MKSILVATAAVLLPCSLAFAPAALAQTATTTAAPAQPTVSWSYGGMGDTPTKGYYKQPKVTYAYGFDKDDPTPGGNGAAPKVKFAYGSDKNYATEAPSWTNNPKPAAPVVAQHTLAGTPNHS